MKKLSLYVFLLLMFCNVGFAECIKGVCINGYGTYTYANGNKYVGNLKMKNETDKELIHLQMEQLIQVSGKIIN